MFSIGIGITVVEKSIVGTNKEEVFIATNTAEAAFYNRKYDIQLQVIQSFKRKKNGQYGM
jgi:hypothetical protein